MYCLYQTLATEDSSKLSKAERVAFRSRMKNLSDDQKEAVFMLICEHARCNEDFVYDPENIKLPYGLKKKKTNIDVDMDNLPTILQRVLYKFSEVVQS